MGFYRDLLEEEIGSSLNPFNEVGYPITKNKDIKINIAKADHVARLKVVSGERLCGYIPVRDMSKSDDVLSVDSIRKDKDYKKRTSPLTKDQEDFIIGFAMYADKEIINYHKSMRHGDNIEETKKEFEDKLQEFKSEFISGDRIDGHGAIKRGEEIQNERKKNK